MKFDELLKLHGYTRYKLSKQTGLQQSTLSQYATGISDPINMPLSSAYKIAKTLEITIEALYLSLLDK